MESKIKILVVDDDINIAELLTLYLDKEGYETRKVHNGKDAVLEFLNFAPNIVLLDVMLPGLDGYQVCREIRTTSNIPVIMLTAKGETFDKVLGLEIGADDYIVKPFETKEVLARIKAVLRRTDNKDNFNSKRIVLPNITINLTNYTVKYREEYLEMPPKEFELLVFLAQNSNRVFTREQLIDKIWGYDFYGDTRTVDVHIKRLREKFSPEEPWGIKTVWGVGYKFEQTS